ncbi:MULTISPECIES: hypothetical protein [Rhodomicrobium]|uniref:hypothetical protein n=1 Tax=Rhodomicrobium TaxID=1068 RepID=UPI000B4AF26E|nr:MULTISPECIES: hypothetical protein [Rhodomicrobium]
MTRTLTHVYDDPSVASEVVAALEGAGFTSSEISIVKQHDTEVATTARDDSAQDGATTGAGIGLVAGTGAGLLASLGIIAIPGLGPLVAAGVLATTLATAAAATVTGGLLGALVDYGISPEDAEVYAENVRRGGTLVSVRTDEKRADEAEDIMQEFDPVDISARGDAYRGDGWTRYDPDAPAYTSNEAQAERNRQRL